MTKIFLSHSHSDPKLAQVIKEQLEHELDFAAGDVFLSSDPNDIPSGDWWENSVKQHLKEADILIPVITPSSVRSLWVAFECGFFIANKGETYTPNLIHPLLHPKAEFGNYPLSNLRIEGKNFTEPNELKTFFRSICEHFQRTYQDKADLTAIIQQAKNVSMLSDADRKRQHDFKSDLTNARDLAEKNILIKSMINENILHHAEFNWMSLANVDFTSAKMEGIDLGGSNLRGAKFWAANLEDAKLGSSKLQGTNFEHANINGATFGEAEFDETTILPDGTRYDPNLGLKQLERYGGIIR